MTPPHPPRTAWHAAVPVMALVAGLLFGTSAALAGADGYNEDPADLAGLVQQRSNQVDRLSTRAAALRHEVEELAAADASVLVQARADQLAHGIGLGEVSGPALRVSLDDAGYTLETLPEGYTVDDVVVHEQDVQSVVNALWAGGAEAMMIQDQRVVAGSAVRCVGNTLHLQGRVYSPPYTITVIGDLEAMSQALVEDPTVANYRSWSQILGLGYVVEDVGEVTLPAFQGSVRPQHATVVTPDGPGDETDEPGDETGDDPPPDLSTR